MSLSKTIQIDHLEKLQVLTGIRTLPKDLSVSTMTIICSFDCKFFINNIGKYIDLDSNGILRTKYSIQVKKETKSLNDDDSDTDDEYENIKKIRALAGLVDKKNSGKKKKKKESTFYNQTEVKVRCKVDDYTVKKNKKDMQKKISVKIFRNGTVHFTGCATVEGLYESIKILCKYLRKTKAIVDYKNNNTIMKDINFSTNPQCLYLDKMISTNISLINANFVVDFNIDRVRLKNLMSKLGHECKYDPIKYSGVNIKYNYNDIKRVAILVFKSGAIVITGGKSCNQVKKAYNFMCNILKDNYNDIIEVTNDDIMANNKDLKELLKTRDNLVQEQVKKLIGKYN